MHFFFFLGEGRGVCIKVRTVCIKVKTPADQYIHPYNTANDQSKKQTFLMMCFLAVFGSIWNPCRGTG